jgi:hypothetical protein
MPIPVDDDLMLDVSRLMLSGKLRKGSGQAGNRIAAILVGLAIMVPLERWTDIQWYFALALGALGYAAVRYIGYFVRERHYIKNTTDAAKRDQISN